MASLQLCVSSPNPPTIALKTIMQMPANPAIFPGTGEGLLIEAIIVLQSCGKTTSFFFFWYRQSAFIKATTTICVRSKNTHTNTCHEKTWKSLECILPSERCQCEKATYCMYSGAEVAIGRVVYVCLCLMSISQMAYTSYSTLFLKFSLLCSSALLSYQYQVSIGYTFTYQYDIYRNGLTFDHCIYRHKINVIWQRGNKNYSVKLFTHLNSVPEEL